MILVCQKQSYGFALHGIGTDQNLPLEIEALICRLLVALLEAPGAAYVTSSINSRQRHGLTLTKGAVLQSRGREPMAASSAVP